VTRYIIACDDKYVAACQPNTRIISLTYSKMMRGRGLPTKERLKRRELLLTGMVLLLLSMLLKNPITPKAGRPLAVQQSDKT
jgi:hypothetical protein